MKAVMDLREYLGTGDDVLYLSDLSLAPGDYVEGSSLVESKVMEGSSNDLSVEP